MPFYAAGQHSTKEFFTAFKGWPLELLRGSLKYKPGFTLETKVKINIVGESDLMCWSLTEKGFVSKLVFTLRQYTHRSVKHVISEDTRVCRDTLVK